MIFSSSRSLSNPPKNRHYSSPPPAFHQRSKIDSLISFDPLAERNSRQITKKKDLGSTSNPLDGISSSSSKIGMNKSYEQKNYLTIILGPAILLGGTSIVYTKILQHATCTLSPLSFSFMLLLAIQYCIQPRVTKKYLDPRINKKSVAMVEEVAKMSLSAAIFLTNEYCRRSIGGGKSIPVGDFILSLKENLSDWTIRSSLTIAAIPSFLYAIQGVLTYTAYQNIDAVTFNGLSQTKIISAAICCFWILGKPQSLVQIGALIMLFSSALVFQGSIRILPSLLQVQRLMKTKLGNSADCQKHDADPFDIGKEQRQHRFAFGVLPCIGAAFLSGLAGSYSQKGLQQVSLTSAGGAISGRDPFLYTVEISFYSACFLLIPILFQRLRQAGKNKKTEINNEASMKSFKNGQFSFWSKKTLIPIFLKAVGGILTALVHKYAGSVLKGFSLILGLVFSGCLQCLFDAKELTLDQIFATILVMWSSWLHFTHPPLPIS